MRRLLLVFISSLGLLQAGTVRVLTDRTETHLEPLFALFERNTGIEVEAVYVKKGMMSRFETRPTEADLVISKTAENLEVARKKGWLQPYSSGALDQISKQFTDPEKAYVVTSYRPRGFYFAKDRVNPEELSSYMSITDPKWKEKVAIRSGTHSYNMSLFCQMMETEGPEKTREFIKGLHQNLARSPQGNDRAQVQAVYEKKADISVGNSYYMGIMMSRDDQKAWAESVGVVFPNQDAKGSYVMRSAAGLTKANRNVDEATKLLEFLVSDFAQTYFSKSLHVYPVIEGVELSELNQSLAAHQPEVEKGQFKANMIPLRAIDEHREAVIEILNEVNFDQKP